MLSEGSQNVQRGQVQQFEFIMGDDVSLQFNQQYFYIKDEQGNDKLRFELDGGLLKYQVYDGSSWGQSQTVTDPGQIQPEDSITLPHNPAITRIDVGNNTFRVFLQNILYLALSTASLSIKTREVLIDNGSYDLLLKMNAALGQTFQVVDSNSGQALVSVNNSGINAQNRPITGIQQSNQQDSAVTLQQLQAMTPQAIQASLPSNTAVVKNVQGSILMTFSNNDIISTKPMRYNPRPVAFQQDMIPDVQHVNTMLQDYALRSQRDAINGYAGLDNDRKLALFTIPDDVTRLNQGTLKTGTNTNVTTDAVQEGSRLYYTTQRVQDVLAGQKGASNGICPLNANQKIPGSYIDSIPIGSVFSGPDAQKTSQLNPEYQLQQPAAGDRYIATDTGFVYMLRAVPFTSPSNWILLSQGGVTSINGEDGVVVLDSDDVLEGSTNKYFASGISDYKDLQANQPHELVKLDGLGHVSGSILGTQLQLEGGFATIHDNQVDSIHFEESKTQIPLLALTSQGITSGKKIQYSQAPVVSNTLDIPHKQYVDQAIQAFIPTSIANNQTSVQAQSSQLLVNVAGTPVQTILDSRVTSQVPIRYDSGVTITNPKDLASKEYVDALLGSFISQTGAAKQFLQATSNVPLTSNGRITNWNVDLQSDQTSRIVFNALTDTFTLAANTYRIYIGAQIKEYTEQELVQIQIALRDTTTSENYFYYSFENDFASAGGNQALSISLPYIWKFDNPVTVELYVQCSNVNYGVYNSYLMIEEFANFDVTVGLDRITDPGINSKIQVLQNNADFNINGQDVMQLSASSLTMNTNKTVKYASDTAIQDPLSLVTKEYVDDQINVSTMSVNNIGQMFQLGMANNQLVQVGQTVLFNTVQLNTSQTMSALNGIITFAQGFVYRVQYKIGCRFANAGTMQLAMRDTATLTNVNGSVLYLTYQSQDSSVSQAEFYIDLRNAVAPQDYQIVILSQTNVVQIYKAFSLFMAEQVQIISDLYFDRIEQQGQTSQLRLQNDKLSTTLDNQLLLKTANNQGNVQQELQIADKGINTVSTSDAVTLTAATILSNTSAGTTRTSTISTAIANQNSVDIQASISNLNIKTAAITAPQAASFQLGTQTPSLQLTNDSTTSFKPILYDPVVAITSSQQLATKAYVDSIAVAPLTNNIQNATNPNSRLQADLTQITNGQTPLDMNSQKITGLGAPSANNDAVTKQYADSLVAGISSNEIKNAINTDSKITAALTEITNGTTPLNMNSQKISNLANATSATDALNRQTADGRYYLNTTPLSSISAPTSSVSLSSQKITNLADATQATDALNRQTGDGRYYANTTPLSQITAPTASVSLSSQKITNLADATQATDALNLQTGDSRYYANTTPLSSITAPTASLSMNSQKITNLAAPTANTDAVTKQYADSLLSGASGNQIVNAVNANSKLVAAQTELTNGTTPLNMNNQKITSLATPTANGDAATKQYVDTLNQAAGLAYMVFSVVIPDIAQPPSSYTSTNNFITNITFQQGSNLGRGYYTASVDTTKVFGGDDYYIFYSVRSLRGSLFEGDNDFKPVITNLYSKSSFTFYLQEIVSYAGNLTVDGVLVRRNNIQGALPIDALTAEQGDARYYANNRYYAFKVLLGDVPFTSGSTNTVYSLTMNSTNVPVNQSGVVTAIDWVRQTGRTDTVRLRMTLDNAIINQRPYQVLLTPETTFVNASGGPTSEWQFGDFTENFILQTFGINNSSTPKFFIHARDVQAANTQSLLVNGFIVITETLNTVTPVVSEYPYYSFTINIGDIPSGEESFSSTNNVITDVVYTNISASEGRWTCTVNSANVFSGADYNIILSVRSLRGSTSTLDNDLNIPIVSLYSKTSFTIYLEETGTVGQNIAIDGILVRRP